MNKEYIEEAIYERTREFVPQCVYEAILELIALEREACAKVCEDLDAWNMDDPASTAADAIRARG
jgi:hypothetical protein